jgi:hypothetical protein
VSAPWRTRLQLPERWRRAAPILLALALVEIVMLRGTLLGGVFFGRDLHLLWQPTTEVFVRAVGAGAWPVWNPYAAFGQPLLANPTSQVFYPPTWLNLLMPASAYYRLFVLGHLFCAASGAALLGRRIGLGRAGATVAGALWMTSGPVLSLVSVWNHLSGAAWVPWALVAMDRMAERRSRAAVAAAAAALATPLLAGSAEMALAGAVGGALMCLRRVIAPGAVARWTTVAAGAAAALGSVVLTAAQLLPAMDLVARSGRARFPEATRLFWSMHPWSLLETLSPTAPTSLPIRAEIRRLLYEGREPYLASLYLGAATLALVLSALVGRKRPYRSALAVTALALIVVSLGRYTPVGPLVAALPLLDTFRYPVKAMIPCALAIALLAGMGFESLREEVGRSGWRRAGVVSLLVLLALALAGGAWLGLERADDWGPAVLQWTMGRSPADLAGPAGWRMAVSAAGVAACAAALALAPASARGRRAAAALVAAIAVADLVRAHEDLNPLAPADFFDYRSPLAPLLALQPGERLFVFDYATPGAAQRFLNRRAAFLAREDATTVWQEALWFREYPTSAVPSAWGIETAFDRDAIDLYPGWTNGLFFLRAMTEGSPAQLRVLRMAGVRYAASLHRENFEDLVLRAELPGHFVEPILLFEVPDPLPRALVVSGARIGAGREALRILSAPDFDPAREVVLLDGHARPPVEGFQGHCRRRPGLFDRVDLQCTLSHDGYVVLSETWDPGWRATLDGLPADVLRANHGFRAVAAPAGTHRIEMTYRPRPLVTGLAISAFGWLAALACVAVRRRTPSSTNGGAP